MAGRLDPKAHANYIGEGMPGQGRGWEKGRRAIPRNRNDSTAVGIVELPLPSAGRLPWPTFPSSIPSPFDPPATACATRGAARRSSTRNGGWTSPRRPLTRPWTTAIPCPSLFTPTARSRSGSRGTRVEKSADGPLARSPGPVRPDETRQANSSATTPSGGMSWRERPAW